MRPPEAAYWLILHKLAKLDLSLTEAIAMARRILKGAPKSSSRNAKVEDGASIARAAVATRSDRRSVPATQAKNRFGEILQTVRDSGPVFIERHGRAQAVVLGIDAYNRLTSNRERTPQERELDHWNREFDALHARMQNPQARQAVDALFSATDTELNHRDA